MIEAQEHLKILNTMDWPNMSSSDRTSHHRDLYNKAYPEEIKTKTYIDVKDLAKVLGG